jgi:hypothetical protein
MVEELLKSIYQDYKTFCHKTSRSYDELIIKRLDFNFALKKASSYSFDQVTNDS